MWPDQSEIVEQFDTTQIYSGAILACFCVVVYTVPVPVPLQHYCTLTLRILGETSHLRRESVSGANSLLVFQSDSMQFNNSPYLRK